ncbi:hypothetical protein [Flavobacterium taihuense]|uniref:Uncharacterized protein n=1 Tax=Flavobacterium taihuense TaxID=2857508 RepID=A0ABS6XWU3_9FLAO|nr:hypothetical protein [Flavobacterium taihuense]MBW4361150.1 hypothetical protein [Flavobacterium taihuense]
MKPIKSFSFKIAVLLITFGSTAILYWFGFHKRFDAKYIPQNADAIVMIDVKNVRNYFVFSFLKTPSQWSSTAFRINKKLDLYHFGIETPDYFAYFHLKNQPITQWFTVAKIENETEFEQEVIKTHYIKENLNNGMSSYYSKSMRLLFIKHLNQILISKIPENQKAIAEKTAEDLFLKKLFLDAKKTEKTIDTNNAITLWIKKNSLLEEDGIINITLEKQEVVADGKLQLKSKYKKETTFSQNPNALLSFGFNFEMVHDLNILKPHSIQINKIIGFDLDSVFVHEPTKTELVLNEIIEKKDSAISYDYDDDFNPIKKVIVHTSREPSFYFSMLTKDSQKVYTYLKTKKAIDNHQIFVNFPLAPTKTSIRNNALTLEANLSKHNYLQTSQPKIGYLQVHFNKLEPKEWHYIIGKNKNLEHFKSLEVLEINLTQENNLVHFQARLKTKDQKSLIEVIK